ncbi:hypothetical protein JYB54_004735 [Salmonella enterica]|nr:hypothetical protein [Salmonella enterica]EHB3459793.1 hypothetical protein [Salmonella enterica]EHE9142609.1 hypothetical protein [Salmonella enterica]EHX5202073.1 hypothetical protein [Salmonella enterica]
MTATFGFVMKINRRCRSAADQSIITGATVSSKFANRRVSPMAITSIVISDFTLA